MKTVQSAEQFDETEHVEKTIDDMDIKIEKIVEYIKASGENGAVITYRSLPEKFNVNRYKTAETLERLKRHKNLMYDIYQYVNTSQKPLRFWYVTDEERRKLEFTSACFRSMQQSEIDIVISHIEGAENSAIFDVLYVIDMLCSNGATTEPVLIDNAKLAVALLGERADVIRVINQICNMGIAFVVKSRRGYPYIYINFQKDLEPTKAIMESICNGRYAPVLYEIAKKGFESVGRTNKPEKMLSEEDDITFKDEIQLINQNGPDLKVLQGNTVIELQTESCETITEVDQAENQSSAIISNEPIIDIKKSEIIDAVTDAEEIAQNINVMVNHIDGFQNMMEEFKIFLSAKIEQSLQEKSRMSETTEIKYLDTLQKLSQENKDLSLKLEEAGKIKADLEDHKKAIAKRDEDDQAAFENMADQLSIMTALIQNAVSNYAQLPTWQKDEKNTARMQSGINEAVGEAIRNITHFKNVKY